MQNLHITNPNFLTVKDEIFTFDVLGGIDLQQMERLVCTLRICHNNFPPSRTTLDLYAENQVDKLIRTLCDKWELRLIEVSKSVHELILTLENYKLDFLKFGKTQKIQFEPNETDVENAIKTLKNKQLLNIISKDLQTTGIIGEDENALILFLALASYKFENPFSVLCLGKSGIGKSYILQKISECLPDGSYSFHTQISENALYYFDSNDLQNKALLIEDLEWTHAMLQPLATLQSQGKLIKTRATKDKDGMLHSTTHEVKGNLCLIACAYSDKNYEELSLPFLCLHLNHSHNQDIEVMEHQKKIKAGLIQIEEVKNIQYQLKCLISSLENVKIVNPFAPFIQLPSDVNHPRKSLLLLLNFIEIITYFFQFQREKIVNKETGEEHILTHPNDIELAFKLLKNNLFRRADELSTTARGFYNWLVSFLSEAQTNQFTALDIRKAKKLHPRTLARYLQELTTFSYLQIIGGNRHREGYIYKLTNIDDQNEVKQKIESDLKKNLEQIKAQFTDNQTENNTSTTTSKTVRQKPLSHSKNANNQELNSKTTQDEKN